jgi:hypothetical protein
MSVFLSPVGNGDVFLNPPASLAGAGLPANGGFINTYLAGTTTPAATYTTSLGNVANTNPIVLTPAGMAPFEIWLTGGISYKFIITDIYGVQIGPTYDNIVGQYDATQVSYTPGGTGAVTTTVAIELGRQWITPEDFGTNVGTGGDDTTALSAWITYLNTVSTNQFGKMASTVYNISAPLPQINSSGVWILGAGSDDFHNGGTGTDQTFIKWIGSSSSGTMLTIAPTSGAQQYLVGNRLLGVSFDCNSGTIANGVLLQSIRGGEFELRVKDAGTAGLTCGVVASLTSDPRDFQINKIRYKGSQTNGSGVNGISLVLNGDSGANPSFNIFEIIDIVHSNALAIQSINADSNIWINVRCFKTGGGTANNSIEWDGGATAAQATRSELFHVLYTTVAAHAKGAGFAVAPGNIKILSLNKENNTPDPVVDGGAQVSWWDSDTWVTGRWASYVPVLTAGSGAFGVSPPTATGRYILTGNVVNFSIVITFQAANSVGTAGSFIGATLPITSGASCSAAATGWETTTGTALMAKINSAATTMFIFKYDGVSFVGANSFVEIISGSYEVVPPVI